MLHLGYQMVANSEPMIAHVGADASAYTPAPVRVRLLNRIYSLCGLLL